MSSHTLIVQYNCTFVGVPRAKVEKTEMKEKMIGKFSVFVVLSSFVQQQQLFFMRHVAMWPLGVIATACIKVGCRNYVKLDWQLSLKLL